MKEKSRPFVGVVWQGCLWLVLLTTAVNGMLVSTAERATTSRFSLQQSKPTAVPSHHLYARRGPFFAPSLARPGNLHRRSATNSRWHLLRLFLLPPNTPRDQHHFCTFVSLFQPQQIQHYSIAATKLSLLSLRGGAVATVLSTTAMGPARWMGPALLCALSYALYNLFIKKASANIDPILGGVILQFVAALLGTCLYVIKQFVTKAPAHSTKGAAAATLSRNGVGWAVAAGAAVGAAEILSFAISSMGVPATQSLPVIIGGSVLLGTVLGTVWLKEALTLKRGWLGVLLIAIGIALVGMDGAGGGH